jgi:hypothetical protein
MFVPEFWSLGCPRDVQQISAIKGVTTPKADAPATVTEQADAFLRGEIQERRINCGASGHGPLTSHPAAGRMSNAAGSAGPSPGAISRAAAPSQSPPHTLRGHRGVRMLGWAACPLSSIGPPRCPASNEYQATFGINALDCNRDFSCSLPTAPLIHGVGLIVNGLRWRTL